MSAENKYIIYATFILISIGVILLIFTIIDNIIVDNLNNSESLVQDEKIRNYMANNIEANIEAKYNPITTGTTSPGDVAIELKPTKITDTEIIISISANTHSVDLQQFNLNNITILKYNDEEVIPVEAMQMSGHHSSGLIKFEIDDKIDNFRIIIKGIPKMTERVFEW